MKMKKVKSIFANALDINIEQVIDTLEYRSIDQWDSIAHMVLITKLEDAFDIMFDTDDILDMSSVKKAKEILTKYGVNFNDIER